jgi:hypothetical protein
MPAFVGTPRARVSFHKISRNIPGMLLEFPESVQFGGTAGTSLSFPGNPTSMYPDPTDDLLHVETFKDLAHLVGRFTINLAAHRFRIPLLMGEQWVTWRDLIDQHDLVVIEMARTPAVSSAKTTYTTVMVGFVDDLYFDRVITQDGEPHYQLVITGSDISEVLYDARLFWLETDVNVASGFINIFAQMLNLFGQTLVLTPAKLVDFVMTSILLHIVDFEVDYKNTIYNLGTLWRWRLRSLDVVQYVPFADKLGQTDRHVENVLRGVSMLPFHELFADIRTEAEARIAIPEELPGSPLVESALSSVEFGDDKARFYLFLRPTPFPWIEKTESGDTIQARHFEWWDWLKKNHSTISESDQIPDWGDAALDRMTKSRREIRSTFFVTPSWASFKTLPAVAFMPFVFNQELISLFGFAPYAVMNPAFGSPAFFGPDGPPSSQNVVDFMEIWKQLTWQLACWNNLNQYFLSGSKVVHLRPDLKVGTVLLEVSPIRGDRYYYIETVHHVWDFEGENSFTELAVTRGLKRTTYDHYQFDVFLGQFLKMGNNLTGDKLYNRFSKFFDPQYDVFDNIPDFQPTKK